MSEDRQARRLLQRFGRLDAPPARPDIPAERAARTVPIGHPVIVVGRRPCSVESAHYRNSDAGIVAEFAIAEPHDRAAAHLEVGDAVVMRVDTRGGHRGWVLGTVAAHPMWQATPAGDRYVLSVLPASRSAIKGDFHRGRAREGVCCEARDPDLWLRYADWLAETFDPREPDIRDLFDPGWRGRLAAGEISVAAAETCG